MGYPICQISYSTQRLAEIEEWTDWQPLYEMGRRIDKTSPAGATQHSGSMDDLQAVAAALVPAYAAAVSFQVMVISINDERISNITCYNSSVNLEKICKVGIYRLFHA